jgi:glycosyltransferase involved in cell wall biosynthesis
MQVSIIIAVFNESATVATLLERVWLQALPGGTTKELIIVESNSTDGSRELVESFASSHPDEHSRRIEVILEPRALGKGHAIRQGLARAAGDIVLIQDADLEYDVADYPTLLAPILEGRTAFVIGSRHLGSKRWAIREFSRGPLAALMNAGGILFHAFFNTLFASRLSDPTSMYKVFRRDCLDGLQFNCNRFDFDFELLGKLMRAGYNPLEIAVSYTSRGFDAGKKIRVLKDPPTWVIAILRARFSRIAHPSHARARIPRLAHRRGTSSPSPENIPPGRGRSKTACPESRGLP